MRRLAHLLPLLFLAAPAVVAAQEMENELKDLTWIGFQQFQEVSRVVLKTTEPAKFHIDSSKPGLVVVVLENTRVSLSNNTRLLDTRFFESPILSIQAKVIEGPSQSVRVEIRLRKQAAFKETQTDNVLALDFDRAPNAVD